MIRKLSVVLFCASVMSLAADRPAKNVILFIGDAGGIPVLNATSIYGYGEPQKLFIQHMPYIGLSDTSSASNWVTDSAAGMTAIVTGEKTDNEVLSLSSAGPDGKRRILKTILEYAEEHGLSTGVVSNSPMYDATPAACYAHVDDREKTVEIFHQILTPRFGDGVDLVLGPGRSNLYSEMKKANIDLDSALQERGYSVYSNLADVPSTAKRVIALWDGSDFDLSAVVDKAIAILSQNPRGFFLMVESDLHTNRMEPALKRAVTFDGIIRRTVDRTSNTDTLVLVAADHSFDFRVRDASRHSPLFPGTAKGDEMPDVRVFDSHTGEEVVVGAQGPGAELVHGFFPNTMLFHVMMHAWGWETGLLQTAAQVGNK